MYVFGRCPVTDLTVKIATSKEKTSSSFRAIVAGVLPHKASWRDVSHSDTGLSEHYTLVEINVKKSFLSNKSTSI